MSSYDAIREFYQALSRSPAPHRQVRIQLKMPHAMRERATDPDLEARVVVGHVAAPGEPRSVEPSQGADFKMEVAPEFNLGDNHRRKLEESDLPAHLHPSFGSKPLGGDFYGRVIHAVFETNDLRLFPLVPEPLSVGQPVTIGPHHEAMDGFDSRVSFVRIVDADVRDGACGEVPDSHLESVRVVTGGYGAGGTTEVQSLSGVWGWEEGGVEHHRVKLGAMSLAPALDVKRAGGGSVALLEAPREVGRRGKAAGKSDRGQRRPSAGREVGHHEQRLLEPEALHEVGQRLAHHRVEYAMKVERRKSRCAGDGAEIERLGQVTHHVIDREVHALDIRG